MRLVLAARPLVCSGCGEGPEDIDPGDGIATLRLVQQRIADLQCSGRGQSLPPLPPSSAVAVAQRISEVLADAEGDLRRLLRTGDPAGPDDAAERLIHTIEGAGTVDWYRRRRDAGVSPAGLVWLALHDVAHHLEDLDLAWARVSDRNWSVRHPLYGTLDIFGDRVIASRPVSP